MGTNYYLKKPPCPHCGRSESRLHIGKSSAGWNFGLRIYPNIDGELHHELNGWWTIEVVEFAGWKDLFEIYKIVNEYDDYVSKEDMIATITKRSHPNGLLSRLTAGPEHMGPYGNSLDCKAGLGTYDLCNYEFS